MIYFGLLLAIPPCFIKPGWHDGTTYLIAMIGAVCIAIGLLQKFGLWKW